MVVKGLGNSRFPRPLSQSLEGTKVEEKQGQYNNDNCTYSYFAATSQAVSDENCPNGKNVQITFR